MPQDSPLGQEDLVNMKDGLRRLDEADNLIKKSISAGIDMSVQQKRTRELREQVTRIKQTFFPGQ